MMPELDGFETIPLLKEKNWRPHLCPYGFREIESKTQIKHALKITEQDQLKLAALSTCIQGGMTNTQKIQQHLGNESVSGRVLRRKLNWLAAPPVQHGFPPLLK